MIAFPSSVRVTLFGPSLVEIGKATPDLGCRRPRQRPVRPGIELLRRIY